jgi:endonuclease/exonuclease/phosphatase family metal-dependent hydrolase
VIFSPIRIASYNIHGGIGIDRHFVPKRIVGVLRELRADIIALQEVESRRTGFDMLGYLAREMGYHAVAGPVLFHESGDFGNGLLSRFPTRDVRRFDICVAGCEPRGALDVELDYGTPLRVMATHLGLRPAERREQVQRLLAELGDEKPMPTILLGDLNEWFLWGRPLRWLHAHFEQTPSPATFPSTFPLFALDRIWVKPRHLLRRVSVHSTRLARRASDHLPVVADLG